MDKPSGRDSQPISVRAAQSAALQFRRLLRGAPHITVEEQGGSVALIRFEGVFGPGWVGSLAAGLAKHGVSIVRGFAEANPPAYVADMMSTPEGLQLVRHFTGISNPKVRKSIVQLVVSLAAQDAAERSA